MFPPRIHATGAKSRPQRTGNGQARSHGLLGFHSRRIGPHRLYATHHSAEDTRGYQTGTCSSHWPFRGPGHFLRHLGAQLYVSGANITIKTLKRVLHFASRTHRRRVRRTCLEELTITWGTPSAYDHQNPHKGNYFAYHVVWQCADASCFPRGRMNTSPAVPPIDINLNRTSSGFIVSVSAAVSTLWSNAV